MFFFFGGPGFQVGCLGLFLSPNKRRLKNYTVVFENRWEDNKADTRVDIGKALAKVRLRIRTR